MKNVVFHAEEVIFSQGDPSTDTFRILKGSVDILVTGKDGADKKIASLGAEEVFGEMGIIDPAPRSATAIARAAIETGAAQPAIMNAANEVAVAAFLAGRIGFLNITDIVSEVLGRYRPAEPTELQHIFTLDSEARHEATSLLESMTA